MLRWVLRRYDNGTMSQNPSLKDLLDVAMDAAYLGGRRTLAYFNTGVVVDIKKDQTPVTCADRESEQIIRQRIAKSFPGHSIIGEEDGQTPGHPDYRWIIDPIDGTKTFIRGVPMYGVLVGVEVMGRAEVGVVYHPALDEMVSAAKGMGCWWNGRRCRVSAIDRMEESALLVTDVTRAMKRSDTYEKLAGMTKFQRTWGDCYGHILVATGRAEIMLDPAMNPWDCAPLLPILEEAGGKFTTWSGQRTIWGTDAVSTNSLLHECVMEVLRGEQRR